MKSIQFIVPALPIAEPRKRSRVVTTGGKSFSQHYTPTNSPVNDYKATVRMACQAVMRGQSSLTGPLRLRVEFIFPRAQSQVWKKRPMVSLPHCKKPDLDNLLKSTCDALNGIAWIDDSQIYYVVAHKRIATGEESACVLVSITEPDE